MPHLANGGQGVHAKRPAVGRGLNKLPKLNSGGNATASSERMGVVALRAAARPQILDWIEALAQRLRHVRVCCGDWSRVVKPSVTFKLSGDRTPTGVFLDPPYAVEAGRDAQLYAHDAAGVSAAVREWAIENADNPLLRIALAGYFGEHDMPADWECVPWKANGGYANQRGADGRGQDNARRERIWFSPHCLTPTPPLFRAARG